MSSSSQLDPPLENNWEFLHGRVDPGPDASLALVDGIEAKEPERLRGRNGGALETLDEEDGHQYQTTTPFYFSKFQSWLFFAVLHAIIPILSRL